MIVNGYKIAPDVYLKEANLREADLVGVDLAGADLRAASLAGADLTEADLKYADLREADLSGANLRGANLYNTDLRGSSLSGADLIGADLIGANTCDTSIYSFTFGKHFGFIHEKILVIGCKTFRLKDVNRKMLKDLGREYNYTDAQIRHYSGIIMYTKKLLEEGVIS